VSFSIFINTPDWAPLPPTITDIGVANPNAQGQAIIKCGNRIYESIWLAQDQILPKQKKVIIETATTIGTKYFAILSANFCIGALERLAELTICTICESKVSEPIFSAIITKDLFPLIVPAITSSAFIQWNGFTRNHRFVDSGFPSVIFRQQEFFTWLYAKQITLIS
jgi:hypothetical protein